MSVIVGFIIGGILAGYAIGVSGLVIAVAIALIAAVIVNSCMGCIRGYVYTLLMTLTALGIACVAEIIWGIQHSHIVFWVAYPVILIVFFILSIKTAREAEESSQEAIKDLQNFLEDYSHFMADHYRHAVISAGTPDHQIELWTSDAYLEQIAYRGFDRNNLDPIEHFFGNYKPKSSLCFLCYDLLKKGTQKYGEDSLVYEWGFCSNKSDFSVIEKHMQLVYNSNFRKIGRSSFAIDFPPTAAK